MPKDATGSGGEAQADAMRRSLERVLAAECFTSSRRRAELLRYLVEQALAGKADGISEYAIGLDVFHKPESFDPRSESTVRAEMSRLRRTLAEYYAGPGAGEACRIEFPPGGYAPRLAPAGGAAGAAAAARKSRRTVWAAAAVVLAAGGLGYWLLPRPVAAVRAVIVLPFVNLTGDPGSDYLADGLTEDLTDGLAHVASLRVVARTSAFQFKGKAADIREIGRRVNADAAIEGSVQRSGQRLRITVQLNRTTDGYHVLSKAFEGEAGELSHMQVEMLLAALTVLRPGTRPVEGRKPGAEALDLVLRARALRGYGTVEQFDRAVTLLNQAIQRDPEYAGAWADLASNYAGAATSVTKDPHGAAAQAKAAAGRALALDPSSAEAYAAEGYADAMVLHDWKRGEDELRRALRLMPQNAVVHQRLATLLMVEGRFAPALAEARTAEELDPLLPNSGFAVGMIYFVERDYERALTQWRKVGALHPDAPVLHQFYGMALEAKGDYAGAMAEYSASAAQFPAATEARTVHLLAVSGRAAEARRRLAAIEKSYDDPFTLAAIYGALGDLDRAFDELERAWQKGDFWMLKVHPFLDPLRHDPRYQALLQRAGFE